MNVETAEVLMNELRDKLVGVGSGMLLNMNEAAVSSGYNQLVRIGAPRAGDEGHGAAACPRRA